ncbi:hypothetical protein SAMN04488515_2445 [Cognatiyoonia koreensis]|uniref:Tyrosine specific protein phosphatases domain-containing protein n=1 Tax=Cognatiyoonia koreensis TaxID=364200 RepID=A0A1I0RBZ4_9RHOB|nr:hypothetical protein [Cognatiyoonia koreensis]SEW38242.1 hypothetical protein SAMN04488515_2445 [Cognatiyoonia koreensis]
MAEDFQICELEVGGGTLALCPLPVGRMADVSAWRPDLVLSLVEPHEMPANLLSGHAVRQFPIPDFGIPSGDGWNAIESECLAVLNGRGRVLAHCKGGCGRSGMAVLRIMLAAGEADALARLRAVRPCAVETQEQLRWAQGGGGSL